jgi:hypothetical protein
MKEPGLSEAPLLLDQDVRPEYRPLVKFMSNALSVGRPLATTPGAPPERVAILRRAFDETVKDPAFIAYVKRQHLQVRPLSGGSVGKLMNDLIGVSPAISAQVKAFMATIH